MIRSLLWFIVLCLVASRFAEAGELPDINFDKIVFLSSWTKSGKVQLVTANEEIVGKADQKLIGTVWKWQQSLYNNDTRAVPPNPESYTLKLLPDGKVSIRADCNVGGGIYRLDGSKISI